MNDHQRPVRVVLDALDRIHGLYVMDNQVIEQDMGLFMALDECGNCEHITPGLAEFEVRIMPARNGYELLVRLCPACYRSIRTAGASRVPGRRQADGKKKER